ncbi:hypothetical protein DFP72DRAFT_848745 [Ephemerocybe angulata]|uniref:Uncharacterized protein n=1 Tax=Ephemerocybe angulata TaxID=980116 RepID=A0A8H6HXX7_9AGAR|nr:hypothetical protein DFP72DRAFT_848745 [Tulosesus angulatus]
MPDIRVADVDAIRYIQIDTVTWSSVSIMFRRYAFSHLRLLLSSELSFSSLRCQVWISYEPRAYRAPLTRLIQDFQRDRLTATSVLGEMSRSSSRAGSPDGGMADWDDERDGRPQQPSGQPSGRGQLAGGQQGVQAGVGAQTSQVVNYRLGPEALGGPKPGPKSPSQARPLLFFTKAWSGLGPGLGFGKA